jgi:hypothetical protein
MLDVALKSSIATEVTPGLLLLPTCTSMYASMPCSTGCDPANKTTALDALAGLPGYSIFWRATVEANLADVLQRDDVNITVMLLALFTIHNHK